MKWWAHAGSLYASLYFCLHLKLSVTKDFLEVKLRTLEEYLFPGDELGAHFHSLAGKTHQTIKLFLLVVTLTSTT